MNAIVDCNDLCVYILEGEGVVKGTLDTYVPGLSFRAQGCSALWGTICYWGMNWGWLYARPIFSLSHLVMTFETII